MGAMATLPSVAGERRRPETVRGKRRQRVYGKEVSSECEGSQRTPAFRLSLRRVVLLAVGGLGAGVLGGVSDVVDLRRRSVCAGKGVVRAVDPMLLDVGSRLVASFHGAHGTDRAEDLEGRTDGGRRSHRCCCLEGGEHKVVAH